MAIHISRLEPAQDYEIEKWLEDSLELTSYQKRQLLSGDVIRFSKFRFYKKRKTEDTSFLWRLTLLAIPIYILLTWSAVFLKWIFTGSGYLPETFLQGFHYPWMNKLKIKL